MIIGEDFTVLADEDAGAETALAVFPGRRFPEKRLKNSSMGSLEPPRPERCVVVEMLTTTGMVFRNPLRTVAYSPAPQDRRPPPGNAHDELRRCCNDVVTTAAITSTALKISLEEPHFLC
jgi:hypothetical protein